MAMKGNIMKFDNRKTYLIGGIGTVVAVAMTVFQPISISNAAQPVLEVSTVTSKSTALYTGESVDFTIKVTNTGAEPAELTAISSSSEFLATECQSLVGRILLPEESLSCAKEGVQISGLPAGRFQAKTTIDVVTPDKTKASFTSTASVDLWWYGRIPGYWKNNPGQWSTAFAPTNFLQDVFAIPNSLLTDGVLDNDSVPGKDTLMSTLTYQGGTTLKGAAQILLRAASAALLNEAYYGNSFPGAPSLEYLITRVNVVLASENKAQYIVLAGYFEKWNNGVRAPLS